MLYKDACVCVYVCVVSPTYTVTQVHGVGGAHMDWPPPTSQGPDQSLSQFPQTRTDIPHRRDSPQSWDSRRTQAFLRDNPPPGTGGCHSQSPQRASPTLFLRHLLYQITCSLGTRIVGFMLYTPQHGCPNGCGYHAVLFPHCLNI